MIDRFIDDADMSVKREKAETQITVQIEHVHEAVAGQEDADQDSHDDHAATASQDRGDGTTKVPDEGIQTRPKKPPDAGCLKLKRVGPGLLKNGIQLIHLMLMLYPMIMKSGPVLMNTNGDDNELHDIEYEFVYTEGDTMGDVGVVYMKTELCPTRGRDNILRFKKPVVGKITYADQWNGMTKPVDGGGDVSVQVQVDDQGAVQVQV